MGTRSVGSVDVAMELICVHSNERFHILRGEGSPKLQHIKGVVASPGMIVK